MIRQNSKQRDKEQLMSKRGEKGRAGSDVDGGIGDLMKTG